LQSDCASPQVPRPLGVRGVGTAKVERWEQPLIEYEVIVIGADVAGISHPA
jgi:hypothetical protein